MLFNKSNGKNTNNTIIKILSNYIDTLNDIEEYYK